MKVHNEIGHVLQPAEMQLKRNGKHYLELIAEFEKNFQTRKGRKTRKTQYAVRCFGDPEWLTEMQTQAVTNKRILVSGELDQRRIKVDDQSIPVTVILVNSSEDITILGERMVS